MAKKVFHGSPGVFRSRFKPLERILRELARHVWKSASSMLRGRSISSFTLLDLYSHVEVDQYEIIQSLSDFVHDVVRADVAMKHVGHVEQIMKTC